MSKLETIKIQFKITNPTVKQKIYQIYQNHIPIQDLLEELIKQADLEYYKDQLVNDFPV